MEGPDIQKILESLERGEAPRRGDVQEARAADIAQALTDMEEDGRELVFSLLDDDKAADVLAEADELAQEQLLEDLDTERVVRLLIEMDPDDAADVLANAPETVRPRLLAGLDEDTRRTLSLLSEYEPESAGGIMTSEVVAVGSNETVASVLERLRAADQPEAMASAFVVDPAGTLVGSLDVQGLLKADPGGRVGEVMDRDVISIHAEADQEEAARLVDHYHITSLPVVDSAGRLQGVITVDDIIDVLGDEASEDMLRLAGTGVLHPTSKPIRVRLLARAPWLSITLIGTFGAGLLIEYIERTWFPDAVSVGSQFKALMYFIPLIGGMAGNVGTQSSTIMVRGFATGEVDPQRPMRVLPGEIVLALLIGLASGLVVGVGVALVHVDNPWLGLVVGSALPCAILIAALAGTLVPFACHQVGVDPAYAGGPFLLTLNDIAAYVIYFLVAITLMDALGVG